MKIAALDFIKAKAADVTLGEALAFLKDVKVSYWPLVLSTWREQGLGAAFVLEVATRLASMKKEP